MKRRLFLLLALLILFPQWQLVFGEESGKTDVGEAWVGFLENGQAVTFAFRFTHGKWEPLAAANPLQSVLKSPSPEVYKKSWIVAWDGKNLGTVPLFNTSLLQKFVCHTPVIQKSLKSNWGDHWNQEKFPRPFAVVTPANYKDPDSWKPLKTLPDPISIKVKNAFLQKIATARFCKLVKGVEQNTFVTIRPEHLKLLAAYGSKSGDYLVSVKTSFQEECEMPDPSLSLQTFLVSHDGELTQLTKYGGPEFKLVDAGDYNDDGVSELVFFLSGYNENGYVLVDGRTRATVRYAWSYH